MKINLQALERALLIIDSDAEFVPGTEPDESGELESVIVEWNSDLHPEVPTEEEINAALSGVIDLQEPDWELVVSRLMRSTETSALLDALGKDSEIMLRVLIFIGTLIWVRMTGKGQDEVIGAFQMIIGMAMQKQIPIEPSSIASWNALAVEARLPDGLIIGGSS